MRLVIRREGLRPDGRDWCFGWAGERVSSPVRFLALMDAVSSWNPGPGSLEPWVPSRSGTEFIDRLGEAGRKQLDRMRAILSPR